MHKNNGDSDDEDEDELSASKSSSTNTHNSDNSWFDPPIENYRFYFQGSNLINQKGGNAIGSKHTSGGFFLKTQSNMKLGSSQASHKGKSRLSSYGKNLFGSTLSREIVSDFGDEIRTEEKESMHTSGYYHKS